MAMVAVLIFFIKDSRENYFLEEPDAELLIKKRPAYLNQFKAATMASPYLVAAFGPLAVMTLPSITT